MGKEPELNEARRLERELIDDEREERKVAELESISGYLRSIADSLANISELMLKKR